MTVLTRPRSRALLSSLALPLVLAGVPSAARAQEPAPPPPSSSAPAATAPRDGAQDIIYTRGGGILRGTLVDAIPGQPARIQLVTGEIATVAAADIARIEHGGAVMGAPPSGPSGRQVPLAAFAPSGDSVVVHLDASSDVRIEQDSTGNGDWVAVCSAPCGRPMPVGPDYRVAGGVRASHVFKLPGRQGDHVLVSVSGGSRSGFVVGIVLTAVSGPVAMVGLFIGLIGSLLAAGGGDGTQGAAGVAAAGWTMFGVAGAGVVGGIVLIVNNARTGVQADLGSPQGRGGADAWRLEPAWQKVGVEPRVAPPTISVPLLSGRF